MKKYTSNKFITGKCEDVLKDFPKNSVDFNCYLSPPYADPESLRGADEFYDSGQMSLWNGFYQTAEQFMRGLNKKMEVSCVNIKIKPVAKTENSIYMYSELVLRLV